MQEPLRLDNDYRTPPDNYLVWAILSTIFCCLPFGIVSIVFASQVNTKWQMGDYEGARQSSKNAKTWALVAFGVTALSGLLSIMSYMFFGGLAFLANIFS